MHAGGNPVSHGRRVDGDQNHHGGLCWEHSCAGGGVPCPPPPPPPPIHTRHRRPTGRTMATDTAPIRHSPQSAPLLPGPSWGLPDPDDAGLRMGGGDGWRPPRSPQSGGGLTCCWCGGDGWRPVRSPQSGGGAYLLLVRWAVVTGGGHPEAPKVGGGLLAAGAMPVRFGGVSGRHVAHPCCPPVLACTRGTNAQPFMPKCFGCGERGLEGRSTDPRSAVDSFGDFLVWVKACGGG